MTPPQPKHTRPLTRRQRALLDINPSEFRFIDNHNVTGKPARKKPMVPRQKDLSPKKWQRARTYVKPEKNITEVIGMSLDAWHLLIQSDERKIEEDKRAEKLRRKEQAAQERRAQRRGRRKRYYQEFYGPSWFPVQAEAMARAKGICEICKTSKATQVHHILPIRYFADSEDAHYINNTLAVCGPCHSKEHRQMRHRYPIFDHLKLDLCRPSGLRAISTPQT